MAAEVVVEVTVVLEELEDKVVLEDLVHINHMYLSIHSYSFPVNIVVPECTLTLVLPLE